MSRCDDRNDLFDNLDFNSGEKWNNTTHDEDTSQKYTKTRKQECHEITR